MRQISKITAERVSLRACEITIAFRTPEGARAIDGATHGLHLTTWGLGSVALACIAWMGGFGNTAHGFVRLTMAIAGLYWATHTGLRIWREHNRVRSDQICVHLSPEELRIEARDRAPVRIAAGGNELRFASRPHWLGRTEERDERRVEHAIGYAFRDAWEVWCESGVDVVLVAAVSTEDDARAVVRHLSEAYLYVTRGDESAVDSLPRTEPA